jgi:hypothetical protein
MLESVMLDMLIVTTTNKVMAVKSISSVILIIVGLVQLSARQTTWLLALVLEESVTEIVRLVLLIATQTNELTDVKST